MDADDLTDRSLVGTKWRRFMHIKVIAAFALALAAQAAFAPAALAWGCTAQGSGNSFGYSHSFGSRSAAETRALAECRQRGSSCVIISCDSNK